MNLPSFPDVDMFSAGVNALYGVLLARQPSHNRGYTAAGLLIMAYFGGIGGGVTRDVLLNDVPSPLRGPYYIIICLAMGLLGLAISRYGESREERFRTRTLAFFKSFTLPWFAILGAHKALDHGLGILAAIVIGLISTTAGGVLIDLFSGVTPEVVRPSQQLVTTAVLAGTVYSVIAVEMKGSASFFPVTLISVTVAFIFRVIAVREHWPSIVPLAEPAAGPGEHA
ncbi:MAG: TRIC cation channel family protein [Candidatus Acidiferrum sp.]